MSGLSLTNQDIPNISNGSLDEYIRYVNSIPLLTSEEEYNLAKQWRLEENVEAARYLVLSHLRLVVYISRSYMGYGLALADIIQEGTIGLMKAIKRFDERKNVRLVTFATYWIRAEINEYVIKNWRIVRTVTTKAQRKLFFNLRSNKQNIGGYLSNIEANDIATNLDVDVADVIEMNTRLSGNDVAINAEDNELAPETWLSNENTTPESILDKKQLDRLQTDGILEGLSNLDERSKDIIQQRWLCDEKDQLTLHQLANKYNISAERVRQIEASALKKMRLAIEKFK